MSFSYANGREHLGKPLLISMSAHLCLAGAAAAAVLLRGPVVVWGGGGEGGAATVRLVSAASVPLPPPAIFTQNHVATANPGLNYPEPPKTAEKPLPKPPPQPPDEKAVEIPARNAKPAPVKKHAVKAQPQPAPKAVVKPVPKPERKAAEEREIAGTARGASLEALRHPPPPQEPNAIPYGQGGPVQGPYSMFQTDSGTGSVTVSGGSGDFGTRYSWYVEAIQRRISQNWLKSTVDPSVRVAPRVYVSFEVMRDGSVVNAQVTAATGIQSLDDSALRAVLDSNPLPPLPPDYPGSSVAVEFWFDFKR